MLDRCENPNASNYERYGGSGVKVCGRGTLRHFPRGCGVRPEGMPRTGLMASWGTIRELSLGHRGDAISEQEAADATLLVAKAEAEACATA